MEKSRLPRLLLCLSSAAWLAACAANGQFASKTNPIDYQVSLARVCTGVHGLDAVFQGLAQTNPGKISPDDVGVEQGVVKLVGNFCDPGKLPTDLAGALASVAVASVDLGNLVAKLSK